MSETALESGDDLRDELEAAFEPEEQETDVQDSEVSAEDAEQVEEPEAVEPVEPEEAAEVEAVEEQPEQAEPEAAEEQPGEPEEDIAAPVEFMGDAKVDWKRLPTSVKREITQLAEKTQNLEAKYGALDNVLSERSQMLAVNYGSVEQGLNALFQLSDFASQDPVKFIQWFAQQRGISLPNGQHEGQAQPESNAIRELQGRINDLQGTIQNQQTASYQSQIDEFANNPAHPYFQDVRVAMGALIQSGQAETLADAYEQAIWANPAIRAKLEAEAAEQRASVEQERANKAKAAKTIKGTPGTTTVSPDEPAGSVREELERAFSS